MDDLLSMINGIDLNAKMPDLSNDDYHDKDLFGKTSLSGSSPGKSYFKLFQDFENEDGSLAGKTTNYTSSSESQKCFVDLSCIKPEEQTSIVVGKMNQDKIIESAFSDMVSLCSPPNSNFSVNDVVEIFDSFNSPNENESSLKNLADITVDQTFDSDLEEINDLLTESFVADLQNTTPLHGTSCYSNIISPHFGLSSNSDTSKCDDILFKSNNEANENLTDFPQGRDVKPVEVKRQDFWTAIDGLDDKHNACKKARANCLVDGSDTPCSRDSISLTSRLLKRFQTKDRAVMADKLRSISGEGELARRK